VVFEDVLVLLITAEIKSDNLKVVKKYMDFAEELLKLDDDYATDVATVSIIEPTFFDDNKHEQVEELLGPKSQAICSAYESN
jgi:hypothetical protein